VCMFEHNSGTPGAISTKLGTHIAIYIYVCKNLISIYLSNIYIKMHVCVYVYLRA
jgi:hypothetical protein